MDDVIGSEPSPRRRVRRVRMPVPVGPRGRRVLAAVAVAGAVAGVVTLGRSGLDGGTPAAGSPVTTRPVQGTLLQLVAGQEVIYALVDDCPTPGRCEVKLLASTTEGRSWLERPLPGRRPEAAVARQWSLRVSGSDDQISVEDPAAGVIHVGTTSFTTVEVVDGRPVARVPAGRESMVELCRDPRCPSPVLRYLEPRTGVRSRLATQPPFPPAVLSVVGSQLWVAGSDSTTGRYEVAVSTDDGAHWRSVTLPDDFMPGPALIRLTAAPEQDLAWFGLVYPRASGPDAVADLWTVPDPATGDRPLRVRPDRAVDQDGAVGLRDGRYAVAGGTPAVVGPDGSVRTAPDGGAPTPGRFLQWGPHLLVVAEAAHPAADPETVLRLVVSVSGNPGEWQRRTITLPR